MTDEFSNPRIEARKAGLRTAAHDFPNYKGFTKAQRYAENQCEQPPSDFTFTVLEKAYVDAYTAAFDMLDYGKIVSYEVIDSNTYDVKTIEQRQAEGQRIVEWIQPNQRGAQV